MKLYKTKLDSYGDLVVVFFPGSENEETRTYSFVGSYIFDVTEKPGTLGRQVCYRMQVCGNTLMCKDNESFLRVMKRNLRLWAYDQRKENS